ncbi:hypothetical protein MXD59_06870 [Frankia sp. Ag45/Mut15]|uniref:Uncharacterized protein n=1 Tax=Frankia umida TaxID=573489 RepID=A0ABT0JVD1_9ACTN|nr:hypothetical protein [Frankia umida]MCK9875498.1 hypothetical protein [Frankia umida]
MTPEARNRRRCRTPVLVITAIAWVATLVSAALLPPISPAHDGLPSS